MKRIFVLFGFAAFLFTIACNPSQPKKTERTYLFNGTDFAGWTYYLKTDTVLFDSVWSVSDSVIRCKGNPFGYLRTETPYENYSLHVEWRWPEGESNSGIFLHIQEPDTIWPATIENQLWAGRAGDFVLLGGAMLNEKDSTIVINKMNASNEVNTGEWNSADIHCKADTIEVYINGVFQNKGTGAKPSKGFIGLQSEGKTIEFRNVYIEKQP